MLSNHKGSDKVVFWECIATSRECVITTVVVLFIIMHIEALKILLVVIILAFDGNSVLVERISIHL